MFINNRNDNKLSQMLATDKYLYILSGNELVRYRFAQAITKQFNTGVAENLIKE